MMEQTNPSPSRRPYRRPLTQRNRIAQGRWLTVMLYLFLALTVALNLVTPDRDYSENENRKLAQKPVFSTAALLDGSYFADWEDYVADQFIGRDFWISLQLDGRKLLGQTEANGVYLAKDDYLIQIPTQPDWAQVDATLAAVNAFAARHEGLRMNMAVIPNAVSILSDKLPDNAPGRDQQSDLGYISANLEGVSFLDTTRILTRHNDEALYYKTDHHWTSLAASYAFSSMARGLGISSVVQGYDIYTVSDSFEGTLASKSGSHGVTDTVQIYVPQSDCEYRVTYNDTKETTCSLYDRSALDEKDHYTVFFGGNHSRVTIETTVENGRCLLLFKDSYANCFVQFLTPYYETIIMIDPRYYYDSVDTVISREGVTDVLFLYNADTFLSDTSLVSVLSAQ